MIYTPHQISIRMRCVQRKAHTSRREMYKRLGCKTTRTVTRRTRRCRWEHNIKMNVKEIGWDGMDWIHLAQNADQWWIL